MLSPSACGPGPVGLDVRERCRARCTGQSGPVPRGRGLQVLHPAPSGPATAASQRPPEHRCGRTAHPPWLTADRASPQGVHPTTQAPSRGPPCRERRPRPENQPCRPPGLTPRHGREIRCHAHRGRARGAPDANPATVRSGGHRRHSRHCTPAPTLPDEIAAPAAALGHVTAAFTDLAAVYRAAGLGPDRTGEDASPGLHRPHPQRRRASKRALGARCGVDVAGGASCWD